MQTLQKLGVQRIELVDFSVVNMLKISCNSHPCCREKNPRRVGGRRHRCLHSCHIINPL